MKLYSFNVLQLAVGVASFSCLMNSIFKALEWKRNSCIEPIKIEDIVIMIDNMPPTSPKRSKTPYTFL